jgi:hypothetical protein
MGKILVLLLLGCFGVATLPAAPAHAGATPLVKKKHHHRRHHHRRHHHLIVR